MSSLFPALTEPNSCRHLGSEPGNKSALSNSFPLLFFFQISKYFYFKSKIQLKDDETIFHGKCYEAFLPNEKAVNYPGKQSAPDYNCQFEKISPTIKQNQITHLRK